MQSKLESLQQALAQAEEKRRGVEARWRIRKSELDAKTEKMLRCEMGAELDAAKEQVSIATAAEKVQADIDRRTESEKILPYPEGTRLYEWKHEFRFGGGNVVKSGKVGIIQLFKEGDALPANMGTWHRPYDGQIVIRELKKDGTPGLKVYDWREWMFGHWLPEGQKYKQDKQ